MSKVSGIQQPHPMPHVAVVFRLLYDAYCVLSNPVNEVRFGAIVCKTVRPILYVCVCVSVCLATLVDCGHTVGWIN